MTDVIMSICGFVPPPTENAESDLVAHGRCAKQSREELLQQQHANTHAVASIAPSLVSGFSSTCGIFPPAR
jgi:hypothetical protein